MKAGIKKAWMPLGATVIWGEWGQYNDMYRGLCGAPPSSLFQNPTFCVAQLPVGVSSSATIL